MTEAAIDVAVVGAGHLGRIHARVLSEIPGVRLVAVVDPDAQRGEEVARERRTRALRDVADLPASVSAVVVATPTKLHHAVAGPLLDRGVHCLVEKPLAADITEARDLVARGRRSGATLMVGHVERFNPAVVALLERNIRPLFFEVHRVSPFSFRSQDVGVVLDMMIHDIDIILHLVQSPLESVDAVGIGVVGDLEDLANARLNFRNGAVANVTASRLALKTERKIRMFAPDCYVTLDFQKKEGRIIQPGPKLKAALEKARAELKTMSPLEVMMRNLLKTEKLDIREFEPLRRENDEFLAAIRERRDPAVTGEHGALAIETADRVVASIKEHLARAT